MGTPDLQETVSIKKTLFNPTIYYIYFVSFSLANRLIIKGHSSFHYICVFLQPEGTVRCLTRWPAGGSAAPESTCESSESDLWVRG